jgi:hypothetical protein
MYENLLSRPVDPSGMATWSGLISGGGSPAQAVFAIEMAAPQHEFWLTQIRQSYQTLLRRQADPVGLSASMSSLVAGGTIEQMQASILGSQEYFQSEGGGTNQGFLTALYRDLLARPVDAAGQALYSGALSAGVGRQQLAGIILTSAEYRQNLVGSYYQKLLQRAPQPEEVNGFKNALTGGARLEHLLAVILGSPNSLALIPLTVTTVTSSSPSAPRGQAVTFTAKVAAVSHGAGTPTGTVTFRDGATTLGTAPLNATGTAVFTTSTLTAGTHTITASYAGDGVLAASSQTVPQTVTAATTTTVGGTASPSVFGQSVTVTATVTSTVSGVGTPAGGVTFVDISTGANLGTGTLNASGQASISVSSLSVGTHTIRATYAGQGSFAASDGTMIRAVNRASTTTTVGANPSPSTFGQQVTLTATVVPVAPGAGKPTGSVTFVDQATGTNLGTGALNSSGQASITTSILSGAVHTIVATYAGDTNFAASNGNKSHTVNAASTTTMLTSMPNPSTSGQSVTFTATVTSGAVTPAGTVTFVDAMTGGSLGTLTLDSTGKASLTTSALSSGTHMVTATFVANPNFATSSGSTNHVVT